MSLGHWGGSEGRGPRVSAQTGSEPSNALRSSVEELLEGPEGSYTVRRVKVGAFTRDVSLSGTQAITAVGFKPYAVFIFMCGDGADNASFGMDDGTTAQCILIGHGLAGIWTQTDSLIAWNEGASTSNLSKISTLDLDGFTLTWTKTGSPTGTADCKYMALGRG